jgi:competence protein ComEC
MPQPRSIPVYKNAPVIRLLVPFAAGILLQWYLQISLLFIIVCLISFGAAYLLLSLLPLVLKFKMQLMQGLLLNVVVLSIGLFITWNKDVRHTANWYGNFYKDSAYLVIKINEPLVEKNKSYKADGIVETVINGDTSISVNGKLLFFCWYINGF